MFNLPRNNGDGAGICATPLCFAVKRWSAEEWEGRARMALNRKACGIPLDATDVEALRRSRKSVQS